MYGRHNRAVSTRFGYAYTAVAPCGIVIIVPLKRTRTRARSFAPDLVHYGFLFCQIVFLHAFCVSKNTNFPVITNDVLLTSNGQTPDICPLLPVPYRICRLVIRLRGTASFYFFPLYPFVFSETAKSASLYRRTRFFFF